MFLLIWTKNLCVQNKSYFLMALKMKWNEKLIFFLFWFIKCSLAGGFLLINLLCHDKFLLNFSFFILLTYLYFLLCDENFCDSNLIFFSYWENESLTTLKIFVSWTPEVSGFGNFVCKNRVKVLDMIWRHEKNLW